jgi:hypothetical protein
LFLLKEIHEKTHLSRIYHPGKSARCTGRKNTYWTKVGVAFAHNGKPGLNIVLTPGIAVSGRLVLLEPRKTVTFHRMLSRLTAFVFSRPCAV